MTWGGGDAGNAWAPVVAMIPVAAKARPRWWPAGLAWALWTLTLLGLAATVWLDALLAFLLGGGNVTGAVGAGERDASRD